MTEPGIKRLVPGYIRPDQELFFYPICRMLLLTAY